MQQRGDTIIEVLLAVTVFSILAVGTMVIMNRGAVIAERSLEITLVRQQVDAQAEMLRYIHSRYSDLDNRSDYYVQLWETIKSLRTTASVEKLGTNSCQRTRPDRSFALYAPSGSNPRIDRVTNYEEAQIYAKVEDGTAYGIYINIVKVHGDHAYDAYIQACWNGAGGGLPQTTGTIVRLYDAKS